MKLLETSYLVDYLRGHPSAKTFYENHNRSQLTASTISLFELAYGVMARSPSDISLLRESLDWVDFLSFSIDDAIEAAQIDSELEAQRNRIPINDTLIAGVARHHGATLIANDEHFERIDNLDLLRYDA